MPRDREEDTEHITSDRPTGAQAPKPGGQPAGGGIGKAPSPQGLEKAGGPGTTTPSTIPPSTTPASTTPASTPQTYTVKAGDSLSKIAKAVYGDAKKWKQIYEANQAIIGKNPDLIKPGQVLTIP
jgi:nucleoid-associated protein YgaU